MSASVFDATLTEDVLGLGLLHHVSESMFFRTTLVARIGEPEAEFRVKLAFGNETIMVRRDQRVVLSMRGGHLESREYLPCADPAVQAAFLIGGRDAVLGMRAPYPEAWIQPWRKIVETGVWCSPLGGRWQVDPDGQHASHRVEITRQRVIASLSDPTRLRGDRSGAS